MSRMTDFCDVCCDACGWWEATSEQTLTAARKFLRQQGWSVVGKEDRCPMCTEKAKTEPVDK